MKTTNDENIDEYNEYWKLFRDSARKQPMRFYNYFYEDMVSDPFKQIKDLLQFIGFYNLKGINVTDKDIDNILDRAGSQALIDQGANILLRKGKICNFYEELTEENAKSINSQTAQYLLPELIQKYNQTCTFPQV